MKIARQRPQRPNLSGFFLSGPPPAGSDGAAPRGRRVGGRPLPGCRAEVAVADSPMARRRALSRRSGSPVRMPAALLGRDPPTGVVPVAVRSAALANGSPAGSGSGCCRTARRDVPRSSARHVDSPVRDCAAPAAGRFDLRLVDAARSAAALIDGEPWSSHNADGPTGGDGFRLPRGLCDHSVPAIGSDPSADPRRRGSVGNDVTLRGCHRSGGPLTRRAHFDLAH